MPGPPNSAQEPTRGRSVGPPAEPARESSERHGGTPPATRQAQWRQAACRVGFGDTSPLRGSVRSVRPTNTNVEKSQSGNDVRMASVACVTTIAPWLLQACKHVRPAKSITLR